MSAEACIPTPGASEISTTWSLTSALVSQQYLCMKTTVDIPDSLLAEAKELAAQRRTTLKALVEQGLRQVLRRGPPPGEFQLRDARFEGQGLQAEFRDGSWDRIRDAAYSGRGG